MTQKYITFIGDVHGCFLSLKALLEKIPPLDNRIVLMGDIINKGKKSYDTFSYVKKNKIDLILGNHEFLCKYRNHKWAKNLWLTTGGMETINSIKKALGIRSEKQVQEVLAEMSYFFDWATPYLIVDTAYNTKIIATHGGISNRIFKQNNYDLSLALSIDLRVPGSFLFNKGDLAKIPNCIQVIGHQPTEYTQIESNGNYRIDTGCVYKKRGMSILTAIIFNLEKEQTPYFIHQPCID
ncbi:MAG: metallophosphoesterase [Bacteroidota bacterium]